MEENEDVQTLAANFPRPPPFYQHFTPENLERLRDIQAQTSSSDTTANDAFDNHNADLHQKLPPELQYLIPPPLPGSGLYQSFGEDRDLNESLPTLPPGIEHIQPPPETEADRAHQLLKISKSLLLNYLEFVGTLAANPELAKPKIDDLRTLFFNAHQLINEYRPHQARESLITMMEQRLAEKRAEVDDVKRMREHVEKLLAEVGDESPKDDATTANVSQPLSQNESQSSNIQQKRVWKALNAIET